jgi:hypothetical protein
MTTRKPEEQMSNKQEPTSFLAYNVYPYFLIVRKLYNLGTLSHYRRQLRGSRSELIKGTVR